MTRTPRARRTLRRTLLAFGVIAALAAVAAPAQAASDGTWSLGFTDTPSRPRLNPLSGILSFDYFTYTELFDWIVNPDPTTGKPDFKNSPATSIDHSADGKTWTYHLRHGLKWSDGQPFTAEDVAWTYRAVLLNNNNNLVSYLAGATPGGISAPDPYTVKVVLTTPNARMYGGVAIPILPKHIWDKFPIKTLQKVPVPLPSVGSGPFVATSWNPTGDSILVPNKYYYGIKGAIKKMVLSRYLNTQGEIADVEKGALDAIYSGEANWATQYAGSPTVQIWASPESGYEELAFNSCTVAQPRNKLCSGPDPAVKTAVVQDPAIRKALAWAIDKDLVARNVYHGQAVPANGGTMSSYYKGGGYYKDYSSDPQLGYHYDPAKAKQILKDGGWDCSSFPCTKNGQPAEFTLWARSENIPSQQMAKLIVAWAHDIGIKVDLRVGDGNAVLANQEQYVTDPNNPNLYRPKYDAFMWDWTGDVSTPDFDTGVLTCNTTWTDSFYCNPEYDKNATAALQETNDFAKRVQYLQNAVKIELQDLPYIPIVYADTIQASNKNTWHNYLPGPVSPGSPGVPFFGTSAVQLQVIKPGPAPAAATGGTSSGGSNTTLWLVLGGAALVVVAAIVIVRRRKDEGMEHDETDEG